MTPRALHLRLSLAGLLGLAGCLDAAPPDPVAPGAPPATDDDEPANVQQSLRQDQDGTWWPGAKVPYALEFGFTQNVALTRSLVAAQDYYQQTTPVVFTWDQSILEDADRPGIIYVEDTTPDCPAGSHTRVRKDSSGHRIGSRISVCSDSDRWILTHETGHALGFWHEQSRPDRDLTLVCHADVLNTTDPSMCGPASDPNSDLETTPWQACMDDPCKLAPPFQVLSTGTVYADYDVLSIMQYPGNYFTKDPKTEQALTLVHPIESDDPTVCTDCIPRRTRVLSMGDINSLLQYYEEPLQVNATGAQFGTAIAVGDFDGDGYDDVAVGAPNTPWNGKAMGAVFLYKGTAGRRTVTGTSVAKTDWTTNLVPWKVLRPSQFGKNGQNGEQFGASLKAISLHGSSDTVKVADLAIGAPGRDGGTGAVYVAYGHAYTHDEDSNRGTGYAIATFGLQTEGSGLPTTYYPESALLSTTSTSDHFGAAITAADFDHDGLNDLAIGAPGANRVALLKHPANGSTTMKLAKAVVPTQLFVGDFGRALAAGDLDGDGLPDLVVGAPQTDVGSVPSGALFVFTSAGGFMQADSRTLPSPQLGDGFGAAVAIGHYFNNGVAQIAVGAPGRAGVGRVFVYQWAGIGASALSTAAPQQIGQTIVAGQSAAAGDRFGTALRTANIHGSLALHDNLIVGASGKGTGAVFVLSADRTARSTAFTDGTVLAPHTSTAGTGFGGALASGDIDNDGGLDLIVGGTGEGPSGTLDGAITVLQGSPAGPTGKAMVRFPSFKHEEN